MRVGQIVFVNTLSYHCGDLWNTGEMGLIHRGQGLGSMCHRTRVFKYRRG